MLQKSTFIFILGTSAVLYSFRPPEGNTGEIHGVNCGKSGCHDDNAVNSGGGSVTVSGLPATYTPGVSYKFSLTVTHGTSDRLRWGFSIAARSNILDVKIPESLTGNYKLIIKSSAGVMQEHLIIR